MKARGCALWSVTFVADGGPCSRAVALAGSVHGSLKRGPARDCRPAGRRCSSIAWATVALDPPPSQARGLRGESVPPAGSDFPGAVRLMPRRRALGFFVEACGPGRDGGGRDPSCPAAHRRPPWKTSASPWVAGAGCVCSFRASSCLPGQSHPWGRVRSFVVLQVPRAGPDVERDGSSPVRTVEIPSWPSSPGLPGRHVCVGFEVLLAGLASQA